MSSANGNLQVADLKLDGGRSDQASVEPIQLPLAFARPAASPANRALTSCASMPRSAATSARALKWFPISTTPCSVTGFWQRSKKLLVQAPRRRSVRNDQPD